MKKLLLFALLLPVFCKAQDSTRNAIAAKRQGVPIFIMSEPQIPYTVQGSHTIQKFNLYDLRRDTFGISLDQFVDKLIRIGNDDRKNKKHPMDFDAIIISDNGLTGTYIKFKKEGE